MSAVELAGVLIRRFEGLRLAPYLDAVGVPTIGYGATYYANGLRVNITDSAITRETAESLLSWMIRSIYLPRVLELCPTLASDERKLAAITSFAFNLGVDHLKNSTLRRYINARRWADVPDELAKWNRAGGRVDAGLVKRRAAEGSFFAFGVM